MQVRDEQSCVCPECNVVCTGQFPGCATVWARGPAAPVTAIDDTRGLTGLFDPVSEPWLAPPDMSPPGSSISERDPASTHRDPIPVAIDRPSWSEPRVTATERRLEELTQAVAEQAAVTARLLDVVERLEASMARRWAMFPATDEHLPGVDLRALLGHSAVLLEGPLPPANGLGNGHSHSHGYSDHGSSTLSPGNGPHPPT